MNKLPLHHRLTEHSESHLGWGVSIWYTFVGYIRRLGGKRQRRWPLAQGEESFTSEAREQLVQLNQKGLGIRVFTL